MPTIIYAQEDLSEELVNDPVEDLTFHDNIFQVLATKLAEGRYILKRVTRAGVMAVLQPEDKDDVVFTGDELRGIFCFPLWMMNLG